MSFIACLFICFGTLVDLMVRVIRSFTGSLVSRGPVDIFSFFFYDVSSLVDALLQLFALSCPSLSNYLCFFFFFFRFVACLWILQGSLGLVLFQIVIILFEANM